jgi:hypothetical protein
MKHFVIKATKLDFPVPPRPMVTSVFISHDPPKFNGATSI